MFNFAVAGTLEKYQPIRREPAITQVAAMRAAEDVQITKQKVADETDADAILAIFQESAKPHPLKGYAKSEEAIRPQQRRKVWKVSDIMTANVQTLKPDEPLESAWRLHRQSGFRHIPIVNKTRQIVGLISDRDLLRVNHEQTKAPSSIKIEEVMTKKVLTCFPETPLRLAAQTMLEEGFSSLPVVDPHGVLIGILTTGDILKALVNEAPIELWV